MKKKTLLALLAGIPDDAEIVFERFENDRVIKKVTNGDGQEMDYHCFRVDVDPNIDLNFHGLTVETNASGEITTASIRFTE
jgi:hypothetical protein